MSVVERPPTEYALDTIIGVDQSLCIHCGSCVRACPGGLITADEFPVPIEGSWEMCIDCGHCVATCPTGAMHQRSMGPLDCEPIDIHLVPQWDRVRQYLTSRRSTRTYINKPVDHNKLEEMLDVTRWAPNGANRQVIHWLVINDPAEVRRLAQLTVDWMRLVHEQKPELYEEAKLGLFVDSWEAGHDQISRGAPCLIQAQAPKGERTAPPAAMIAIAYAQVAAPALGLATTFTGSINTASESYPPLIEALEIPDGYVTYGTFLVGEPAEKYFRIPTRRPLDVTWR